MQAKASSSSVSRTQLRLQEQGGCCGESLGWCSYPRFSGLWADYSPSQRSLGMEWHAPCLLACANKPQQPRRRGEVHDKTLRDGNPRVDYQYQEHSVRMLFFVDAMITICKIFNHSIIACVQGCECLISSLKTMEIQSTITTTSGHLLNVVYNDLDSERELGEKKIQGVHAYCFCGDTFVLVYSERRQCWTPPGGSVEEGESISIAIEREVREETNMRVLKQRLIGCQDIFDVSGVVSQVRSVCIVEPYDSFVRDPDGEITKIERIDPKDYKKYFDWGTIGDHVMKRALDLKAQMDLEIH